MELSEKIVFNVSQCADVDAIYLTWRNAKGGFDSWLFDGDRVKTVDVEQGEQFAPAGGRRRVFISKKGYPRIVVRAGGLNALESEGIRPIVESPDVYIDRYGELTPVVVVSDSFRVYDDSEDTVNVELEIELSAHNSLTN